MKYLTGTFAHMLRGEGNRLIPIPFMVWQLHFMDSIFKRDKENMVPVVKTRKRIKKEIVFDN